MIVLCLLFISTIDRLTERVTYMRVDSALVQALCSLLAGVHVPELPSEAGVT
jgi:hypothetical protein